MAGVTNESIAFMLQEEEDEKDEFKNSLVNNNNNIIEDVGQLPKDKQNDNKK